MHLTRPAVFAALTFCVAPLLSMADEAYPGAGLLVETAQLSKPEFVREVLILDARDRAKYEAGHVPGARWADHAAWSKAFGQGQDAEAWSKRISELGITAQSKVVVYDDNLLKDAARIWWILKYWGVQDVRVVNGGWTGWQAGKHPVDKAEPPAVVAQFIAQPRAERLSTKQQVLGALQQAGKLQIVDTRSEKEHCGIDQAKTRRAGAIPGAKHLEWSDLIDQPTQRFKPAEDLRKLFAQSGISLDQPTATHCAGGGRASVMAFGLELMGAKQVSNYYAGWSEWGADEAMPVTPGKPKSGAASGSEKK